MRIQNNIYANKSQASENRTATTVMKTVSGVRTWTSLVRAMITNALVHIPSSREV